jgi:hypothetical protein
VSAYTLVKRVGEMELMPRGYAVAWWKTNEAAAICLPIGLHVIASIVRTGYMRLRMWRFPDERERAWREGYERGRDQGYRHGEAMGRLAAEEELRSVVRVMRSGLK